MGESRNVILPVAALEFLMRENIQIGVKCATSTVLTQFSKIWHRRQNRCSEQDCIIQTNTLPAAVRVQHSPRQISNVLSKAHLQVRFRFTLRLLKDIEKGINVGHLGFFFFLAHVCQIDPTAVYD